MSAPQGSATNPSESALFDKLRNLISVVDELRDVGLQQYISLPRIVVVGTQSSGKSSVLESVVGLDFLPRGDGVVTRRPLELRLQHLSSTEHGKDEAYAIFDQIDKTKKFYDFEEVRAEIDRITDMVAGKNKGIVDDPIILNVHATGCPDMTLIDLPGITRVSIRGSDQGEDIEKVTRDMTMRYIQDPRTIILAVLSGNTDMSTSDALQLARKADPQGLRTIGVITKIDIMDKGTDAVKMLRGDDIPLRLGYVGIKNRSQADIRDGVKVKQALVMEQEWFTSHRVYGKLPPGMVGTSSLVAKLTKVFYKHLRNFLPEIKREINDRKRSTEERLKALGEGVPVEVTERVQLMWTMLADYCDMFKNTIRGKYDRKLQLYLTQSGETNSGGAQIRAIFNDFLIEFEDDITSDMTDEEIERAIRTHEGDALPGFPSPDTFEFLILPHLRKIDNPAGELLNQVSNSLDMLSQRIARTVFRRFPRLADEVLNRTQEILLREKELTRVVVENIVSFETGYLFTNDQNYLADHGSMEPMYRDNKQPPVQEQLPPPPPTEAQKFGQKASEAASFMKEQATSAYKAAFNQQQEKQKRSARYSGPFVQEIRRRIDAYFNLIIHNVRDSVPKAIGFFLVRQIQDKLQFELFTALNKADMFSSLLGEPEHIMEERRALTSQMKIMDHALMVLNRDPAIVQLQMEAIESEEEAPPRPATAPVKKSPPQAAPAVSFSSSTQPVRPTLPKTQMPMPTAARPKMPVSSLFDDSPKQKKPSHNPLFD